LGWPVLAIQHLGRWASVAVLGYIEEALAELAPGRRDQSSFLEKEDDWTRPLEELATRMAKLRLELSGVKKGLSDLQRSASSAAEQAALTPVPEPTQRRYLKESQRGKVHREASSQADSPPFFWRTGCGWFFGTSPNWDWTEQEEALKPGANLCTGGCDLSEVKGLIAAGGPAALP